MRRRMHPDQIDVDEALVRRLLRAEFPHLAHLPLRAMPSWGTVNAVFRLGDELAVRVPITPGGGDGNARECDVLGVLGAALPFPVPRVVGRGGSGRADAWSVLSWLDGVTPDSGDDAEDLVPDLVELLLGLRAVDPAGAPPAGRGPVRAVDGEVHAAIARLPDRDRLTAAWEPVLDAGPWPGPPVWVHGDLLPGNLLVHDHRAADRDGPTHGRETRDSRARNGRLAGVIDFGLAGVGDPACDLMIAWHLLPTTARAVLRRLAGIDDDTWTRGRGWALAQGLIALPYYADTNPGMAASARHVIAEVLGDGSTVPSRPQGA